MSSLPGWMLSNFVPDKELKSLISLFIKKTKTCVYLLQEPRASLDPPSCGN